MEAQVSFIFGFLFLYAIALAWWIIKAEGDE